MSPPNRMSGNAGYQAGARLEVRVMKHLAAFGWVCFRSAGSKSPVDIVACRAGPSPAPFGRTAFVQSRRGGRLDPEEWNALYDLALDAGAAAVLVSAPPRGELTFLELTGWKRLDGPNRKPPARPWSPESGRAAGTLPPA